MHKIVYTLLFVFALTGCFIACESSKGTGNPSAVVSAELPTAYFGDTLVFSVEVTDEIPLRVVYANLYYGEKLVSARAREITSSGTYEMKVSVPYLPNQAAGTYRLQLVIINQEYAKVETDYDVTINHFEFPYLTLVAGDDEYTMEKVGENLYQVSDAFPPELGAYIKTPETGGKVYSFGWENDEVKGGITSQIPFTNLRDEEYTISFNTLTFEASPVLLFYIDDQKMESVDKENFRKNLDLKKDAILSLRGFGDLSEWWIRPDFFSIESSDQLTFQGVDGQYLVHINSTWKILLIEPLTGSGAQQTLAEDGSGTIWVIGDQNIGMPHFALFGINWDTSRGIPMLYLGDKKHQITLVTGQNIRPDEIDFKFFHQKGWGGEFGYNDITTGSDLIFIGNGSNGRGNGNIGLKEGVTLENNSVYVFTIDLSNGNSNAVLSVEKK